MTAAESGAGRQVPQTSTAPIRISPGPSSGTVDKGLAAGTVGTFSGAILGISCVAPGYTLTASIGLIVASVGLKMPAVFIAGFIPMLLTAFAYRELNSDFPDCGASFTWSTKAFGPYVGWMCGWGMVIATIIVLSNIAAVAVRFFYLFLAGLFHDPGIADLAANKWIDIATTLAFIVVATWISSRGIETSVRLQRGLVCFQMVVLVGFAIAAIASVSSGQGHGVTDLRFSFDWFNPFTGITINAFVIGVTGSVFAFWGWDTCLTLGEECKDPEKVPGRAGMLCVVTVLLTYLLVAVAVMMYAGVGTKGLGLGNTAHSDNAFGALARPVLGGWGSELLFLAILASAVASVQTTILPAARCMLAMGASEAFPKSFARISPRFQVPIVSTLAAGLITSAFYVIVRLLSERVLLDTVAALGILVCWYYGITAFACVWYFRKVLFYSIRNALFKFLFPLLGGVMLALVFVISEQESIDPRHGSGASIGGIGLVFYLAFGILLLGFTLMIVMRILRPKFFRTQTLPQSMTTDLSVPTSHGSAGPDTHQIRTTNSTR
ncbi:APC family permease [Mycobacterium sp. 050134]|uniref:APC family permease n=1 Tax=Mycobacterium sp. 050134 TaxID=3096111 RepID=UPI002ED8EC99